VSDSGEFSLIFFYAFHHPSVLESHSVSLVISWVFMFCRLTGGYQRFRVTCFPCLQDVRHFDPEDEGMIFV
jgi:hypothetical protein